MKHHAINMLYAAEDCIQQAHEALDARVPEEAKIKAELFDLSRGIQDIVEEVEDNQSPEDHPNYSVVALDDPHYWQGSQSHMFRRHYEHKGRKFRVTIKRDAYDAQCYAIVEGFDPGPLSWNKIGSIPFDHWTVGAKGITYVRALSVEQQGWLNDLANELTNQVRMLMANPDEVV